MWSYTAESGLEWKWKHRVDPVQLGVGDQVRFACNLRVRERTGYLSGSFLLEALDTVVKIPPHSWRGPGETSARLMRASYYVGSAVCPLGEWTVYRLWEGRQPGITERARSVVGAPLEAQRAVERDIKQDSLWVATAISSE